jgi:hypothetical protein
MSGAGFSDTGMMMLPWAVAAGIRSSARARGVGVALAWQNAALRAIFASFASFFVERAFFATVMVFGPIRDIFEAGHRNRECER